MNEYEVIFTNGEVVEVEALTPEAAEVIALEDAAMEGRTNLVVEHVRLLNAGTWEM